MRLIRSLFALHVMAVGALLSRAFAHGSAAEVAGKWATNLGNAQQGMQAGVQRVTQAPGQAAVAQRQKWVNSLMSAHTQDKWARNTAGVSLQQWQQSMTSLGIQRAAQGAQEKKGKMEAAMNSLLPFIDNLRTTVRAMPSTTEGDREQRALAWIRGMRGYQRPTS